MLQSIDEKPYTEILDGRAIQKVSPKRVHSMLQWRIAALVQQLAGDRGDVGTEWRFYMDPPGGLQTSLVPDVAFVYRGRLDALVPLEREKPPFSPDIAIELRSPGDNPNDVEWKMHAYLTMGGSIAFDVLPESRTIRAYTHDAVQTLGHGDRFACDAVPWLTFEVDDLFAGIPD
jgi:Uma2 family endonuclease